MSLDHVREFLGRIADGQSPIEAFLNDGGERASRNALLDDIAWHAEQIELDVTDYDAHHHAQAIRGLVEKLRGIP